MIHMLIILALISSVIWFVYKALLAFNDHPEVGKIIKNSFKKKPNSMKVYNFSEYPVVIADGLIFEILDVKRTDIRIWKVKLNIFNATDESKQLNLSSTLYKWGDKKEIELTNDSSYRVKPGNGLVSSSDMIVWSLKKPSEISVTFKCNDKPGYANINLHKIIKLDKVTKSSPLNETTKKEIEESEENSISELNDKEKTDKNSNIVDSTKNSHDDLNVNDKDKDSNKSEQEEQRKLNGE